MMEQKSMTALISAFSRAYHAQNNEVKIFDDSVARHLFTDEEYRQISNNMSAGIGFFNPAFEGKPEEALRWVVDHQLSPTPLGRAAFAEQSLERAVRIGAQQALIFGAGYDTFAYRQPPWADTLTIFEIDHPATAKDKQERLNRAHIAIPAHVHYVAADFTKEGWETALLEHKRFDRSKISCCTMLGLTHYLSKQTWAGLLSTIGHVLPEGSSILFDYPDENSYTEQAGERVTKQAMLAAAANEKMLASYSYGEMEHLLSAYGFLVYEHLTPQELTEQYFAAYNQANPTHRMQAFEHGNLCLAVKK